MSKKLVVSECCNAQVQHYPTMGLGPMESSMFFCSKCNKECKTKVIEQNVKK